MEMLSLTKAQALDEVRQALGLSVTLTDCTVQAVDGLEIDDWLEQQLDCWYGHLLHTADPAMLPTENMSQAASVSEMRDGLAMIRPDNSRVRVLLVKMADWNRPVVPVPLADADERFKRLGSPFGMPGPSDPLAVIMPDGSLWIGPNSQGGLTHLLCVYDPRPLYVLDRSLLGTISQFVKSFTTQS